MDERRRKRSRRHGAAACAALVFALSALLVPAGAVSAPDLGGETQLLVPVGKAIGVKLFAEGVLVVGLSENEGAVSPAKKGGMKAGDLILTMNDVTIGSTEHLQSLLAENGEREAAFGVRRGGRLVKLAVCPKKGQDGVCRLGAWIRDSMAGIGTVTFYDPQTGAFAALGHGITDVDTGKLMPLSRGMIAAVTLFIAVINWNDYYSYMMFIGNKTKLQPFAWVLHRMLTDKSLMNQVRNGAASLGFTLPPPMALRMATIICATLPIVIIYPFIQPYFTKGMTLGAVKE